EKFFADTVQKVSADTVPKVASPTPVATDTAVHPKTLTLKPETVTAPPACVMEFVKEKTEHAPDSIFFNILKITNNNGKPIQGVVRISVPIGWKVISEEETVVDIPSNSSGYIPIRVSLARTAVGGVSYLVNATLNSNRKLFPDKNQTSISKTCYITIPKKTSWDIIPLQHTVYFNRYVEYSPLKILLTNKGNGTEIVKIDLEIGSSLTMYGSLGKRYFTSIELKPHSDSILSFPIKYISSDESIQRSRDFRSLTVRATATVDKVIKRTSVNFKYLESVYNNVLAEQVYPLNIEVQMQNLLSQSLPRMSVSADGNIYFKNDHALDYFVRFSGIAFSGYTDAGDFSEKVFWRQSRFRAHYDAGRWEAFAGDVGGSGIGMIGTGGRGIGGNYQINKKHNISGTLTTGINHSLYSGNVQHETTLLKRIPFISGLSFIANDYNKMNTFGAAVKASYPFYPGHRISVLLAGSQTQHLYNNQTFTYPNGNFITTTDPGATFFGLGTQVDYSMNLKKVKVSVSSRYVSKHFSQYFNGRLWVNGTSQYIINKKYYVTGGGNFNQQDPQIYNKGIVSPKNKFSYGRYNAEIVDKINSKLVLSTGPIFDHSDHRQLKIKSNGDSIQTRFSAISPKWSLRLRLKNSTYSSLSLFSMMGYTYITHADDSTYSNPIYFNTKKPFFNTNTGVNITQKNWGINISYYTGSHNINMESDYYYSGNVNKTIRIMPYFQRYFLNRKILFSSYNSYYYQTRSNMENITLSGRFSFFFDKGWTLFVDNNLYMNSRISAEGTRTFSKTYGFNIGFRKSFDIPQPSVKYYDLTIICFKDINGNGTMDSDEHGISDIVITIDRQNKTDSITGKPIKFRGQFSPAEMVTDNFGQVIYYRIPEGECSINVYSLINLKDIFNVKGQKQTISISSDSTYYIPFVQTFRVNGKIILNRDEYSSAGSVSVANIRITATDSMGNSFPSLTTLDGSYTLYVPQAGKYRVNINNIFGDQFFLQQSEYEISFDGAKEFHVDFVFDEKKRKINIASTDTSATVMAGDTIKVGPKNIFIYSEKTVFDIDTIHTIRTDTLHTVSMDTIKNLTVITDTIFSKSASGKFQQYYYSLPVAPGVSYRVQIATSSVRITPSQRTTKFRGAPNVSEYTENGIYKYTAGDLKSIDEAKKLKAELRAKGYKDCFLVPFYGNKRVRNKGN
ncbi:MAG: SPOR domain-containing protein, partial [Bacteroidota bacterium]